MTTETQALEQLQSKGFQIKQFNNGVKYATNGQTTVSFVMSIHSTKKIKVVGLRQEGKMDRFLTEHGFAKWIHSLK